MGLTPPNPADLQYIPHNLWWQGQREGVEQILELWRDGTNIVMVNGPTGAGKSLVGLAAVSAWSAYKDKSIDVTVLTQTRDLQSQYSSEFPEARAATGRSNWNCAEAPGKKANQCPLLGTGEPCWSTCPYRIQREAALKAPIRAINYAFYGATDDLFHAPIMICDEADYLGELLTNAKSVDLSILVDNHGLQLEQGIINVNTLIQVLQDLQNESAVPEEREQCKRGLTLLKNKRYVVKGVGNLIIPWPESRIVQDFARQPTIIMSATVFAPQYWSKTWNLPIGWVELPCVVPAKNRPIRLMNIKKINMSTTEKEWIEVIAALDNIISSRVEWKGLVHSVSNWLTDLILKYSKYKHLMFKAAGEGRLQGIAKFIEADRGILIGPNLTRGLDLKDDLCRWIVFPKIPYPSMGDPRIKDMLKGGEDRYHVETLGAVIQGAGRGVRSKDDYCEIFILDSGMGYLLKKTQNWLPLWIKEAIMWN